MSADELALLGGIHDAPFHDLPKLVYADWLAEFGTDDRQRATEEWIRLACSWPAKSRSKKTWLVNCRKADWIRKNWLRLLPTVDTEGNLTSTAVWVHAGCVVVRAVAVLWAGQELVRQIFLYFGRAGLIAADWSRYVVYGSPQSREWFERHDAEMERLVSADAPFCLWKVPKRLVGR